MKPPALKNLKIPEEHLLRSPLLESLYRDQIPPTASNLRCRWAEIVQEYEGALGKKSPFPQKLTVQTLLKMYAGWPDTLVIVDQQVESAVVPDGETRREALLKMFCPGAGKVVPAALLRRAASPNMKLRAEPEVFLAGYRVAPEYFQGFIDPLGVDVYPEVLWQSFNQYLHDLLGVGQIHECTFAGGRYGTAKELVKRSLPFLHGRSLGEVAHIVQLALTPRSPDGCSLRGRGLLSYQADKMIVPRVLSQKHLLADRGLPTSMSATRRVGQDCVTDEERWAELKHVLHVVLAEHPEGRSLALLKVDVEHRFDMILDQSVFKEVKLSHIFETPQLKEDFEVLRVAQQGGGVSQVIIRPRNAKRPATQTISKPGGAKGQSKAQKSRGQVTGPAIPMAHDSRQSQVSSAFKEPDGSPRRRSWPFAVPPNFGMEQEHLPEMNLAQHHGNLLGHPMEQYSCPQEPMQYRHAPPQSIPGRAPGVFTQPPPPPASLPPPGVHNAPPPPPLHSRPTGGYAVDPMPYSAYPRQYSEYPMPPSPPLQDDAPLPISRMLPPHLQQHHARAPEEQQTGFTQQPMLPIGGGIRPPPGLEEEVAASLNQSASLTSGFLPAAGFSKPQYDRFEMAPLMESNSPKASDVFGIYMNKQPGKENQVGSGSHCATVPEMSPEKHAKDGMDLLDFFHYTPEPGPCKFEEKESGEKYSDRLSERGSHEWGSQAGSGSDEDREGKFNIWGSRPLALLL
jgi:hypothetical protein